MTWTRPTAALLLALAATLLWMSAWTAGEDGNLAAGTEADHDTNMLTGTIDLAPGAYEVRIPALQRVGAYTSSTGDAVLDDLQATLDVYSFRSVDCQTHYGADPEHRIFGNQDAFSASSFHLETPPLDETDPCGDHWTMFLVWNVSGAPEMTIDTLLDQHDAGTGMAGRVVLRPDAEVPRHATLQGVAGAAIAAALLLALWPDRREALPATDGSMGAGLALAEAGEHWLLEIRRATVAHAALLVVALVMFTGILLASTAGVSAGDGEAEASHHPYAGWGILEVTGALLVDGIALLLGGRGVVRAQRSLRRWRSRAQQAPIEGDLDA